MAFNPSDPVLIAGGGGFIGGALAAELLTRGFTDVRCADIKPLDGWYQVHAAVDNRVLDLSERDAAYEAAEGRAVIFNLAADMGGMGFIENNKAACMLSVLVTTHLLMAGRDQGAERLFYASSACVYPGARQENPEIVPLRESEAYPADPEDGYGWEKLFGERMARHFSEDYAINTRVARYHNVYGPYGTWEGGREKAPAAICRKVADAVLSGTGRIEIWGDGEQSRSFMYIDDCVEGTLRLTASEVDEPLNIGSNELVTINQLVDIVESFEGVTLERDYILDAPQGVRGRNSDNALIQERLGWEPSISLRDGMRKTYDWIKAEMAAQGDPGVAS